MTRVRECTIEDLDFLTEKVTEFNALYFDVPLDYEKLERYLVALITEDQGVVLRSEHGIIGGIIVEDPVRNHVALVETAWYTSGKDGLRLLRSFERIGRENYVDEIRMTTLNTSDVADRVLTLSGYEPIETSYRLITKET